mmetsp:Transcript_17424/g.32655  ORF Transcript_17424/g.32655 Transcript_17424/m.32655 type:complete len:498 (+) Transcript_17424:207-1700(+)|eukprot:CAMPEP_0201665864 /NCGR_PEP_ID=MMETSP0494-20130426/6877_1 /ASSEMBLY_ACC=CAM_ASM_000839 /TAXON_ID=420259 /ORGANISM="Thalassiosira gravida, Strain GMp14c1" /LENGTH=497 /DNA_ID=CAMNT_0048144899 /DNA_START=100 /DNA_END=1593 /DNA_ORIENTATION=+
MSTSSTTTHEVQLAIYDLSMGMARGLSAQFLGPQHAVEIIPHTAIIAYGKEYYFGQGIEWCSPHEFRATRGIHPIDIQPLGHTACTEQQFEEWCRAQAANGSFGMQSYDFFHRNCNNFSEEAAKQGLRLQKGVPQWILDLPQKFLNSPMGMVVRPMLEQMQISNTAPTNVPSGGAGLTRASQPTASSTSAATPVANPWANISAAKSTAAAQPSSLPKQTRRATPLLDKQTALLSTDTGVVKICIDRLKPDQEHNEYLSKLADTEASWMQKDINSLHQYLRTVIENDSQNISFALMLLRLLVLRQSSNSDVSSNEEQSQSTQLVANLLMEDELKSLATRSMAWCVLSNAIGSTQPPDWENSVGNDSIKLTQVIDQALSDSNPTKDGASSPKNMSLRQSAAAFLYNSARVVSDDGNDGTELSEGMMSILLGCFEHLHEETDVISSKRHYMAVGQLLKSHKFGETAVELVKDLGLVDGEISIGTNDGLAGLAKEVAVLLN